jgi:hypothetical protein
MSYFKWIEYSISIGDIKLEAWATKRLAESGENIVITQDMNEKVKFSLFKANAMRIIHGKHIFREDSIFNDNHERNMKICKTLFSENTNEPDPKLLNIYNEISQFKVNDCKIAVVMAKHINCSSEYIISDLYYHYSESAKKFGLTVNTFDSSNLMYSNFHKDFTLHEALTQLENFFNAQKIDVVITDGNFIPDEKTVNPNIWNRLKSRFGFKIITVIADLYDSQPDFYKIWNESSDQIICFNRITTNFRQESKCILSPCLAFNDEIFINNSKKDIDLLYLGTNSRNRLIWINALGSSGVNVFAKLHDRKKQNALEHLEYGNLMSRAKLVFNNGWVNEADNIVTGRFFEAVLAKAVVLQEVGSNIDEFFIPFKHYVPVSNLKQAEVFSKFLLENEDIRNKIAEDAEKFYQDHYSSNHFWKHALNRLNPG